MISFGDNRAVLRDGASFHPVEGGGVLFSAARQRLYALNPAAGAAWLCLSEGLSRSETARVVADAFGIELSEAAGWVRTSLESFQSNGLLGPAERASTVNNVMTNVTANASAADEKPRLAGQHRNSVEYCLLAQSVRIAAPDSLQPAIDSLLGSLRVAGSNSADGCFSGLDIDIMPCQDGWNIVLDGQHKARCETEALVAELERLLVQTIVPATPHLLTLHAATTQRDFRTFLLAGASGAGKTTLSVALVHSGWLFGSDEIALLGWELDLSPLPLPACIKADSFSLVETWFPQLRTAREHKRYDKTVKYLAIESHPLAAGPGYVIFPQYNSSGGNAIRSLDSFSGLQRLLENCVFVPPGFQHDDVHRLLQWHDGQQYFELFYNSAAGAVALLSDFGGHHLG